MVKYCTGIFSGNIINKIRLYHTKVKTLSLLAKEKTINTIRVNYARLWHQLYLLKYSFFVWKNKHPRTLAITAVSLFIYSATLLYPILDKILLPYLDQNRINALSTILVTLGGSLIGATAIASSFIMFAMQVNVERMPHGLFRKFSEDKKLMGAFGCAFLLAILIATSSIVLDKSLAVGALLISAWATILILGLIIYAYQRALLLINPLEQLKIVVVSAKDEMQMWTKRAKRAAPLLQKNNPPGAEVNTSTHDMSRLEYFEINKHWTSGAKQAVLHTVYFSRRYAEQGDHEVSRAALSALAGINMYYVEAKGKTFFADTLLFANPLSVDQFINDTLEHLRQNVKIAISRGDEQQIEQNFNALAQLVAVYINIDYSSPYATKKHAHLAAGYLSEAVHSVVPHNMPDVLIEGIRLMGQSANFFLIKIKPNDTVTMVDKIALIACTGAAHEKYRPVTLAAIEQLAKLTFYLLQTRKQDIGYPLKKIRENINMIVTFFLEVPDAPLLNLHSTYLAPYYSVTQAEAFIVWLTNLVNSVLRAEENDENAKGLIDNIAKWADGLYQTEKELLLKAIDKKSHFTFDITHWIANVTRLLIVLSTAPSCDNFIQEKLRKHALWLISVLSWIPDNKEAIAFVETHQITEKLFEVAREAKYRNCQELLEKIEDLLLNWGFKAGKYQTGWEVLEHSIYAISALALCNKNKCSLSAKQKVIKRLSNSNALDQSTKEKIARNIREQVTSLHNLEYSHSSIKHAMGQIDRSEVGSLLNDIADLFNQKIAEPAESS
jgi:hypothetical protein